MFPGNAEDRWVEIRQFQKSVDAEQHALVLIAMSINCLLIRQPWGIGLLVAKPDAERAEYQLDAYRRENTRQPVQTARFAVSEIIDSAVIYAAILVLIQAAAESGWFGVNWFSSGAANAGAITDGQWWRSITALFLHGDLGHLFSNVVFGAFFAVFVGQMLGAGLAWLAILASGTLGNIASALLQDPGHTAIGASTAVFGALGLLAALTWQQQKLSRFGLRRFAPLAAGIMLLAFLGVGGERTDVGGHLAGFVAGAGLAVGISFVQDRIPSNNAAQMRYGAIAIALIAVAWILAIA